MEYKHISVLLKEVIEWLNIAANQVYIDGTLGAGGYTKEILEKDGRVLAIDLDQDAVAYVQENFKEQIARSTLKVVQGNFINIKTIVQQNGYPNIAGIVFDLGVSSYHLDQSGRGFTFRKDELLDMRMDKTSELTAGDIVNKYSERALYLLFLTKGEEHNAEKIARAIIRRRVVRPLRTTQELVEVITHVSKAHKGINPATKVFQALRIEVNNELANLKQGIQDGFEILAKNGRMVIVDFHSLEDRIVKQEFDTLEKDGKGKVLTNKPIRPSSDELHVNRRSRSAKMRVIEKI